MINHQKYQAFAPKPLTDRQWPNAVIKKAPIWCSVDLRDGNQALPEPMNPDQKLEMFRTLCDMGFRHIEVGFPSASEAEFDCVRALIERNLIPEGVTIQVLTPAREHLVRRTFEAIEGCKLATVHLYSNTSPFFRDVVFKTDREGVMNMAVTAARLIRELSEARADHGNGITFEYSPEFFCETEDDFAVSVSEALIDAFGATPDRKLILNLPSTVQLSMPNHYADQIERFARQLSRRDCVILSAHPHNDRGTGVADAELAMMAGAERIEGTLFGNGERTGNVDLVTVALNLYTQGIDPELDFTHLNRVKEIYERTTGMRIHERQPYAGELVFTAFSGSHQDAIKKTLDWRAAKKPDTWHVPYLPIDPEDIGRMYEPIIRINSQSGKGGAAFILHNRFGYKLPREMHAEFGRIVKNEADRVGGELSADQLLRLFVGEYSKVDMPYRLIGHDIIERGRDGHSSVQFSGRIAYRHREYDLYGVGNGPIDAFFQAMHHAHIDGFSFVSYHEHAIGSGSDAKAVAYIELEHDKNRVFGVGIESNVSVASIKGILSAINRALLEEEDA